MSQYKVPQDVEADDKLLGPFTFRQFVYLMIMGGCIGLCFALFQIFPLLAILPLPFAIFFAVLALPLKKDQPMETYLAAVVSYHLKPKNRFWNPGQRETTVEITAPKRVEEPYTRDLSQEEAGSRLSFLANVIDTEGYAIRGDINNTPMRERLAAEIGDVPDMLDTASNSSAVINQLISQEQNTRHQELVNQMRTALARTEAVSGPVPVSAQPTIIPGTQPIAQPATPTTPTTPIFTSDNIVPNNAFGAVPYNPPTSSGPATIASSPDPSIITHLKNLASNQDYSVETIQKEAARLSQTN